MSQTSPTSSLVLHNRYRIDAKLGAGRLATVYRAFDERLQRQVLVHMLRSELVSQDRLRQRFLDEAHASARRSHQSLLEVFDSGEVAGRPYMVTEYVAGRTIREIGALSPEDALLYFRQVVGAVAACQAAGVPHPPISSNNLVLVEDGHVELLESWLMPAADVAADLACYRAPERTEGQAPTETSAVYALGLLLYEMLIGRRLITGSDPREIAQAHLSTRIPPLSELRPALYIPALERLLLRLAARRPEERPVNATMLAGELDDLRRELNSNTRKLTLPPSRTPSLAKRINRRASERAVPRPLRREPAPAPAPQPTTPIDTAADPGEALFLPTRSARRSFGGIATLLLLFLVVGCGAYYIASATINQVLNIRLPQPQINLPSVPDISSLIELPEWLTGVAGGGGEVYVVDNAVGGLNVRAEPNLSANVIVSLPSGTRVRKIGGPQTADGVSWLQVRVQINDQTFEGWLSSNFVKSETGSTPNSP